MVKSENYTLILYNSFPFFLSYMTRKDVHASRVLRKISFSQKIIRKVSRIVGFSQIYWFDDWKKDLKNVDTVIIFAPLTELETIELIKRTNPSIRIIYWFWNPVFRVGMLEREMTSKMELWSFDPSDCTKYGMKFNTTFYFNDIDLIPNEIIYDAVFVGLDKGRRKNVKKLQKHLKSQGLLPYFQIIESAKEKISYRDYLKLVSRSKAIVDIIPEGQSGLTVRPMESIFFEKKLISTDETLLSQDFYNKNNIFIVGMDDESELADFINSPYEPLDEQVVNRYDFSSWLKRFEER